MLISYGILITLSGINLIAKTLVTINLNIVPLILLFVVFSIFIKGIRQWILIKSCKLEISFKDNMIIFISGMSLISSPGGIGEAIKSKFLKDKFNFSYQNSLSIVLIEKFHEVLGMVILLVLTSMMIESYVISSLMFVSLIILFAIYLILRSGNFDQFFTKIFSKIKFFKFLTNENKSDERAMSLLTKPKLTIVSIFLTVISMLFELVSVFLIFISLNLEDLNFVLISQLTLSSLLLGNISLIPGGIGIMDGSLIALLKANGFELSAATSAVLIIRLSGTWFKSILGLIVIKFHRLFI